MGEIQKVAANVAAALGRESPIIRALRPAYESALDWTTFGRGIEWNINDVVYRIDPRYRHMMGRNYDVSVAALLRQAVQPGAICLDVGANVGVYVLQFAHWSRPNGRVIGFEPNPEAREILQKHVRLNSLERRVSIVSAAVGAEPGNSVLYKAGADGMSRLGAPNAAIGRPVSEIMVPVTTLDYFCKSNGLTPDWLLIDIEGFEIAALRGASKLIAQAENRLGIVVEMHPSLWDSAGTSRSDAEGVLSKLGLRCYPLTGQTDSLSEYGLVRLVHE